MKHNSLLLEKVFDALFYFWFKIYRKKEIIFIQLFYWSKLK